ncbi:RidA family protein [Sphingobium sp.]|uniref:RidA family protein n=1 Tax=Sphingobium sp. TaxID=1912891 RepID=UPI0028BD1AD6|nr:RidA family protein [Sphingobium sp.]
MEMIVPDARRSIEIEGFDHAGQPIPAASRKGPLVVTGGVYGLDPETGTLPDDVGEQVRLMFGQLQRILAKAGGGFDDVVRMTVYVKDPAARPFVNEQWLRIFPDAASRPARHTLTYEHLPANMLVQCDAIAMVTDHG